jgi:hypothetical protein
MSPALVLRNPACDSIMLSPRQFEVLRLVATGNSTAQIAAILGMSRNTARTQIQSILVRTRHALPPGGRRGGRRLCHGGRQRLVGESGRSLGAAGFRPLGGS